MPFNLPDFDFVQARFTRTTTTGVPSGDYVVNTFVFGSDGSTQSRTLIRNRLDLFYTANMPTTGDSVGQYLSNQMGALSYYFRAADATPGTPGEEFDSLTWTRPTNSQQLPPELSVCTSFRGVAPYTARRRGRVFLGPLNVSALNLTTGRVAADFVTTLNEATQSLAEGGEGLGTSLWVIASRAGNSVTEVAEGYTNDHFDVQRRRDPSTEIFSGRTPAQWTKAP